LTVLTEHFKKYAAQLGVQLMPSCSAIQPIMIGDSLRAVAMSQALLAAGFLVSAIRPPTVPDGSARLRVTFSATHELHHVDRLLDVLAALPK
ncbi:MAG: aminotransferase class I/II-fold pyridoxal phosphate-dependent enzyme, partial [Methylococcales bacterium]